MMTTGRWEKITPTTISNTLKKSIKFCRPNLGFEVKDVSNGSLRTAGTMLLFCDGVYSSIIKLIFHWSRNEMLCYLHLQTEPLMRNFSQLMIMHGKYSFLPQ